MPRLLHIAERRYLLGLEAFISFSPVLINKIVPYRLWHKDLNEKCGQWGQKQITEWAGFLCVHVFVWSVWQQGLHLSGAFWHYQNSIKVVKHFCVVLCAVMLFCISLFSLLVFLKYQIYYDYPLETYLEYPIIIAQGNFWKPCFGNEMGLSQHSKSLHVGTVLQCSNAGAGGKRELTSHIKLNSLNVIERDGQVKEKDLIIETY